MDHKQSKKENKMKKTATILTIVMSLTIFMAAPAFAETKLLFNLYVPRFHVAFTGIMQPWGKAVEQATQGRVKIEYPASSVGPVPRQLDIVKKGVADISLGQHVFTPKLFALPAVASLPFKGLSSEAASVALWRTHVKYLEPAIDIKGVKLLSHMVIGPSHLFTTKKQVVNLSDAKNLKIRLSARYASDIAKALGVVMVAVPGPASYEVVSRGTVDGTTFSFSDIYNFKVSKFLNNVLIVPGGLYAASFSLIMNQEKWDSISKADQRAIENVSGENFARLTRSWDEADKEAFERLRKSKTKISYLKETDGKILERDLDYIVKEWIELANERGVDGKAALDYYMEQANEIAKQSWRPKP